MTLSGLSGFPNYILVSNNFPSLIQVFLSLQAAITDDSPNTFHVIKPKARLSALFTVSGTYIWIISQWSSDLGTKSSNLLLKNIILPLFVDAANVRVKLF